MLQRTPLNQATPIIVGGLLTHDAANAKLAKSTAYGYYSVGLSLAPNTISGHNVCPKSTAGCRASCIYYSGHGAYPLVMQQRIARTQAFFANRAWFVNRLGEEIETAKRRAARRGYLLACRLNVFSDLPWEKIAPELFVNHVGVRFYDYTKIPARILSDKLPAGYHLTFSRSETNDEDCQKVLAAGLNVAAVFRGDELPKKWWGRRVINGDQHDLRFLDPRGVIVGLKAKGGRGRADETGFVIEHVSSSRKAVA